MWKGIVFPGQLGFVFSSCFPRELDRLRRGQVRCGRPEGSPQLSVTFPQVAPLAFPIVQAQAFLIF